MMKKLQKLGRLLGRRDYAAALRHGVAASIEHEHIIGSLEIGSIVDIGANKGQFSVLSRHLHPKSIIHAFEPLDEAARTFRALFANDSLTTLHQIALAEAPGEEELHVSARPDSSSLLPIAARQTSIFPGTDEKEIRRISVTTGDLALANASLPSPTLIKLDVQGYELTVLKGMTSQLQRAAYVYAELSFTELYVGQALAPLLICWLYERGYELAGVYNLSTDKRGLTVQADALFRNVSMKSIAAD